MLAERGDYDELHAAIKAHDRLLEKLLKKYMPQASPLSTALDAAAQTHGEKPMSTSTPPDPPGTHAIADGWATFAETVLPTIGGAEHA